MQTPRLQYVWENATSAAGANAAVSTSHDDATTRFSFNLLSKHVQECIHYLFFCVEISKKIFFFFVRTLLGIIGKANLLLCLYV